MNNSELHPIPTIQNKSTDMNDIYSYWPMHDSSPRATQIQVLDWLESLPSHIKYILCEVPVGGGKSPIALNLSGYIAKSFGSSYIMTPQKVLQKQYEESFDNTLLHSLYGKANYKCVNKGTSCDLGCDIKPKCEHCPQRDAFQRVKYAPNVVFNYTLGFLLFKYVLDENIITHRNLIVFDEAHTIETHLTEFNAIVISEYRCKQIGNIAFRQFPNIFQALEWIKDKYIPVLMDKIHKMNPVVQDILDSCSQEHRSPTREELHSISLLKELVNHKEMINEQLLTTTKESINEEYVLVNENKTSFKFKELYGKRNFKKFVEPMADKFLFMSSTILDKDAFCSDLGLNPDEAAFISLDSEFDVENRPIFYIPTSKMTYGWDSKERTKDRTNMISKIVDLCTKLHNDENGIIHAGSFQIAKWLVEALEGKITHQIMHHNPGCGRTRDEVLKQFQIDDGIPKLLISPSITEGLDLKDDKGRFAIFAKVPYPFLGDAWVKKRMSLSDNWYKRQTLISMIQGGGRVVRSKDDWGHVYILDSSFGYLLSQTTDITPEWWRKSITKL